MSDLSWLNEKIKSVPQKKFFYNFMKIFLFKWNGLKYKEMYLILTSLYKNKQYDEKLIKEKAFNELIRIYYYNNNKYPKDI